MDILALHSLCVGVGLDFNVSVLFATLYFP